MSFFRLMSNFAASRNTSGLSWRESHEAASLEGLESLLAVSCGDNPEARQHLLAEYSRQARIYVELERCDGLLREAGVQAIVLKGHSLLGCYGGRLGLRPGGDIDLVVRPGQLDAVRGLLHTPDPQVDYDVAEDLVNAQRIRGRGRAFPMRPEEYWAASLPLAPLPGSQEFGALRRLEDHWQFVQLSVHALKHGYSRLIWLLDLMLLYARLCPARLAKLAAHTGTARAVALSVHLIQGAGAVAARGTGLPPLNVVERKFARAMLARTFPAECGELLTLFSLPDLPSRIAFLWDYLWLRPALVRAQSSRPLWSEYLSRLGRAARALLRLLQ